MNSHHVTSWNKFWLSNYGEQPLLWSTGQSSWLQIQGSQVWFPALPDFLRSGGSGTGSTQPREYNRGVSLELREYSQEDPLRWPCDTVYPQKLALTLQTSSGHSVGIVHSQTKATEFSSIMGSTYWVASYHSACNSFSVKLMCPLKCCRANVWWNLRCRFSVILHKLYTGYVLAIICVYNKFYLENVTDTCQFLHIKLRLQYSVLFINAHDHSLSLTKSIYFLHAFELNHL
jgi:hypothetical protein